MPSLITTAKLKRLVYFLILIRVKFVKDLRAVHTWCVGTSIWVLPQNGIVPSQLEYPIRDHEHPAGFLKTLSQNGSFKSATIAFFLFSSFPSPRSFFFSFPFSSLLWFWSFLGLNKPALWRFFTQMTANFVRLVFKKSARYILIIIWNKERRYIWIEFTSLKPRLLNLAGSLWNFQVFASNIYVMGEHWSYLRSSLQRFPSKR